MPNAFCRHASLAHDLGRPVWKVHQCSFVTGLEMQQGPVQEGTLFTSMQVSEESLQSTVYSAAQCV